MTRAAQTAELLQQAVVLHRAGQLDSAASLYRRVLKIEPTNADACNLLGAIALSQNELATAEDFFRRALAANPSSADIYFNLGNALSQQGRLEDSLAEYSHAVALKPDFADAHLNFGVVLHRTGRLDAAVAAFEKVVELMPADARAHYNLSRCYHDRQQHLEEEKALIKAITLQPSYADARASLASLYGMMNRFDEAIAETQRLIALQPLAEFYSNLGDLLLRAGRIDESVDIHQTAYTRKPQEPIILHNYASALHGAERYDEAADMFSKAVGINPHLVDAHIGLAKTFEQQGRIDRAVAALEQGLVHEPSSASLKYRLALRQLTLGNFKPGWENYEYRFLRPELVIAKRPEPPPYWTGEDLTGKTIWIWGEQGVGDEILYSRMVDEISARAARCIFECAPRLAPIFARSFPATDVIAHAPGLTMSADYQIPLASLGRSLRPDLQSFGQRDAYLRADPTRTAVLRERYKSLKAGNLVVGILWRSRNAEIGVLKNTTLDSWAEILGVPGITFVNLQYGDCGEEIAAVRKLTGIDIFQDPEIDALQDMDGFFSQVMAMDLVIGTSNTAIHVAGSLGIPTWLLLSGRAGGLWYWFQQGDMSPWYSSVRIIRGSDYITDSKHKFSWKAAMVKAAQDLRQFNQREKFQS